MKEGIKLTSAYTGKVLYIDTNDITLVEGVSGADNFGNAKIYTHTKGNFYVMEEPMAISQIVFGSVKEVK